MAMSLDDPLSGDAPGRRALSPQAAAIMVVDDEPGMRNFLYRALARSHALVEVAEDAEAAEALRRRRYAFDEEALRPYFALDAVLDGLFSFAGRLFGGRVEPGADAPTWNDEVRVYDLRDGDGLRVGSFYLDLYPRESKRDGAWMNPMVTGGPVAAAAARYGIQILGPLPESPADMPTVPVDTLPPAK